MAASTKTATVAQSESNAAVTINAAFLREIKEGSGELWQLVQRLRELCSHPISIHLHPKQAVELLEQLQDQLALYFSLEEYYGYFDDPISVAPWFSQRADTLRTEHQTLYLDLGAIVERAERMLDQKRIAALTRHIVLRFGAFCEQLKAHEQREEELILQGLDEIKRDT